MFKTIAFAMAIASTTFAASSLSAQSASTTLIGCVYQEKDVPGRAPNVAERAGILEDYILAELSPAEAAKPSGTTGSTVPTTYSMYKLEKAADRRRGRACETVDFDARHINGHRAIDVL